MEGYTIKNGNGEDVSFEEAVNIISKVEDTSARTVEFHGQTEWTLDRLKEMLDELGTLNYEKVKKLLAGKIVRDWVNERVQKALEDIDFTGEGLSGITDTDSFTKACKKCIAVEITDDIIDTMYAAQRHGM